MFDYLLLPYGSHPSLKSSDPKVEGCKVPAGLSEYGWKRVSGESVPASETVETTKTGIVKFLGSGLLPEMEVALQLLIAAADTRHGVSCTSDIQNWQLSGVIDWNDLELVRKNPHPTEVNAGGYIGAPPNCRPECIINGDCNRQQACSNQHCINPCDGACGLNSECTVRNHLPICKCPRGYDGDPFR